MPHKTVYLIRHGITPGNEKKRFIGNRTDEPLSEAGRSEAEKVSLIIKDQLAPNCNRVCSGPMKRAFETASILFGEKEITIVEDLTEIDFGTFENKDHNELAHDARYLTWIEKNGMADIPEGENVSDFSHRSYRAFEELLKDTVDDERIAVICHGGNIMAVMSRIFGGNFYDYIVSNLCGFVIELETDDEGIRGIAFNKFDTRDNSGPGDR